MNRKQKAKIFKRNVNSKYIAIKKNQFEELNIISITKNVDKFSNKTFKKKIMIDFKSSFSLLFLSSSLLAQMRADKSKTKFEKNYSPESIKEFEALIKSIRSALIKNKKYLYISSKEELNLKQLCYLQKHTLDKETSKLSDENYKLLKKIKKKFALRNFKRLFWYGINLFKLFFLKIESFKISGLEDLE